MSLLKQRLHPRTNQFSRQTLPLQRENGWWSGVSLLPESWFTGYAHAIFLVGKYSHGQRLTHSEKHVYHISFKLQWYLLSYLSLMEWVEHILLCHKKIYRTKNYCCTWMWLEVNYTYILHWLYSDQICPKQSSVMQPCWSYCYSMVHMWLVGTPPYWSLCQKAKLLCCCCYVVSSSYQWSLVHIDKLRIIVNKQ